MIDRTNIEKIIDHYGKGKQVVKAIEELGELQKPLCKFLTTGEINKDSIYEEVADVEIMLEQIKVIFKLQKDVIDRQKEFKISRTVKRIGDEKQ